LPGTRPEYIDLYMKRMLIELDDRCARDLERVAPAKKRVRAEFVRLAIRHAIDLALEPATARAYAEHPLRKEPTPADLVGWDESNLLARPAGEPKKAQKRRGKAKSAA
jgi:hypothetical protein